MRSGQARIAGWVSCLVACIATGPVHAAAIELGQLELGVYRGFGPSERIGSGYLLYDAGSVRQQYEDWLTDIAACEADPDSDVCSDVDYLDIEYPVISAAFTMYGHTFRDDEIRWTDMYNYYMYDQPELNAMSVVMGRRDPFFPPESPYLEFAGGDDVVYLEYFVAGNRAECHEASCNGYEVGVGWDEDYRSFDWREVPVPTSEPGSRMTFLAAFLALLAISRRSTARPLRIR